MTPRRFIAATAAIIGMAALPLAPAHAQIATVCVNCSDEVTQYLNYGETLLQTAQSASQLATQVSQYVTMLQNLTQLPEQLIGEVMSPFRDQLAALSTIYNAANSLYSSATQVQSVINGTLQSGATMNMSPSQFTQYIAQQAQTQGGIYRQMLQDNNQKLQDLQQTSAAFKSAADNVPNIKGTQDGIQQVATLAAASGHVATEMLADQKTALGMTLQEKAEEAASKAAAVQLRQQQATDMNTNLDALGTGLKANAIWR